MGKYCVFRSLAHLYRLKLDQAINSLCLFCIHHRTCRLLHDRFIKYKNQICIDLAVKLVIAGDADPGYHLRRRRREVALED